MGTSSASQTQMNSSSQSATKLGKAQQKLAPGRPKSSRTSASTNLVKRPGAKRTQKIPTEAFHKTSVSQKQAVQSTSVSVPTDTEMAAQQKNKCNTTNDAFIVSETVDIEVLEDERPDNSANSGCDGA